MSYVYVLCAYTRTPAGFAHVRAIHSLNDTMISFRSNSMITKVYILIYYFIFTATCVCNIPFSIYFYYITIIFYL